MGLGIGRLSFDVKGSYQDTREISGNAQGFGTALELSMGGTVLPGFVLGGTLYGESIASPASSNMSATGGLQYGSDETFSGAALGSIGVLADWYVNPNAGWHVQAAVAPSAGFNLGNSAHMATATMDGFSSGSTAVGSHTATGPSAALGAGWEGWVGEQWSLGLLLRVTYAHVTTNNSHAWAHDVMALPSLLGTATFH